MLSDKVKQEIDEILAANEVEHRTISGDISQLVNWLKQSVSVGYSRNGYDQIPMWLIVLGVILLAKRA